MGPNDSRGAQELRRLFPDRGAAKAIGQLCGVVQSVASRWRRGERRPDSAYRTTLKRVLGIEHEWWDEAPRAEEPQLAADPDEVTPAEAPAPKRRSSAPPPADGPDAFDSDPDPTAVTEPPALESTPKNLPPMRVSGRNVRTDTNPDDRGDLLPPSHVNAHPELHPGERPDEDERVSTPSPDGGL
jgi:hypothetical protein